ncbi:hypothetical protein CP061683_1160B, partial [Chlamydia psittaci 06-1683]
MEKLLGWL